MLIQNTNPANVMPEQRLVRQGFAREDLFVAVHEQFMTETAEIADIVLPATMFVEHDDIYRGGGQSHIMLGPKLVEPPEDVRTNLFVIEELAKRLGVADQPGFGMSEREHIERILSVPGLPSYDDLLNDRWFDRQPDFRTAHYLDGFAHPTASSASVRIGSGSRARCVRLIPSACSALMTGCRSFRIIVPSSRWWMRPIRSASPRRQPATSSIRASPKPARHGRRKGVRK